MTETTNLLYQ